MWHFWANILLARLPVLVLHNPVQMLVKMNGKLLQQFLNSLFAYGVLCQVTMFLLDFSSNHNMASIFSYHFIYGELTIVKFFNPFYTSAEFITGSINSVLFLVRFTS